MILILLLSYILSKNHNKYYKDNLLNDKFHAFISLHLFHYFRFYFTDFISLDIFLWEILRNKIYFNSLMTKKCQYKKIQTVYNTTN